MSLEGGCSFHRHPTTKRQKIVITTSRLLSRKTFKNTFKRKCAGQFPVGRISAPTRKTLGSFSSFLVASTSSSPSQPVTEAYRCGRIWSAWCKTPDTHTHPFPSFLFSFLFNFYFLFPSDSYTTNNTSIISFSRLFKRNVWDCLLNVSGIVCKLPENCPRRTKHNQDVTHFVFPLPISYRETDKKFASCSVQQQNAWAVFSLVISIQLWIWPF